MKEEENKEGDVKKEEDQKEDKPESKDEKKEEKKEEKKDEKEDKKKDEPKKPREPVKPEPVTLVPPAVGCLSYQPQLLLNLNTVCCHLITSIVVTRIVSTHAT
jgi:hypothetical protein